MIDKIGRQMRRLCVRRTETKEEMRNHEIQEKIKSLHVSSGIFKTVKWPSRLTTFDLICSLSMFKNDAFLFTI